MNRTHPLIVSAVALSAFLVFLIQPLAARSLLPAFGGAASVWVTALVFYQVALAGGYLLAHVLNTRLSHRGQTRVLAGLALAACLTLSVLPAPLQISGLAPAWQLLLSLAVSVGPPFIVLTVAGPLIQGWAAGLKTGARQGRDIYSLCAVSSGASLLALLSYPLLMEPLFGTRLQARIWDGLFLIVAILILLISRRVPVVARPVPRPTASSRIPRGDSLRWWLWSAAGVMILTSTSGFIGQEIAAIPLLWVIPLILYLVTWIVAFSGTVHPGPVARGLLGLTALGLMVPAVDIRLSIALVPRLGFGLAGMTLACFCVHAALYGLRPAEDRLTRFYATVAAGGAVGGLLAGVLAIQVLQDWRDLGLAFTLVALLAGGDLVAGLRTGGRRFRPTNPAPWLAILLLTFGAYLVGATGMERPGLRFKHRDFNGLVRVVESGVGNPQRHRLVMFHGATVHGFQFLHPDRRGRPTTYFGPGTGAEIAVTTQRTLVGPDRGLNIGVVGLGVGTMASHLRKTDRMRFYELSPVVAELAGREAGADPSGHQFSYLREAAGEADVVIGDARLSLATELHRNPEGRAYDLLVLDAFAGDAVPVHLLTREAFSLYTAHLAEPGMIAVHVSCNWLDLVPVIYAWAEAENWQALTISTRGGADGVSGNHAVWLLLYRDPATLPLLARQCRPLMAAGKIQVQNLRNIDYGNLRPWTDNRSDLLALMRSRIRLRDKPEVHASR